jgi:ATP/maltotriose-dependent transcriptional regulator MalT
VTTLGDRERTHPLPGEHELLERDRELSALESVIDSRSTRLLVIEGPPGIGKTALLTEAKRRGRAAGLRALGARLRARALVLVRCRPAVVRAAADVS